MTSAGAHPDPRHFARGELDEGWARARELVLREGWNATAYQILNPGMSHWFSAAGDAVAGYVTYARVRVVAGAPVCEANRLAAVAAELEADARARGERVLYFGAGTRLERLVARDAGRAMARLGAQPVWDPQHWPAVVARKASLRAQLHRARNKGVEVHEWAPARARESPELQAVVRDWLATRGLPPLSFMTTPDLLGFTKDRRIFVATREGRAVGFLVATPVPARAGWLVEQWPRTRDAPNGTTHLLVDAAMRAFEAAGVRYATLGLAPLSRHGDVAPARGEPAWLRLLLRWMRAHGRRFYNFAGLEAFKASMAPASWEPVFAIAQGPRFTPGLLHAVAGAFSGGSPERLVARALASAAGQELHRVRERWFDARSSLQRRAAAGANDRNRTL